MNVDGELAAPDSETGGASEGGSSGSSAELWQRGRGGRWLSMRTVFGGVKPSWLWLSPLHEPRLATAITTRLAHTLTAVQQEAANSGLGVGPGGESGLAPGSDADAASGASRRGDTLINV